MSPSFSIVYPTRHRPEFIREALRILERQQHDDFEVVVSDNFVDPNRSCAAACEESGLEHLRYVRPPEPVGMFENWNFALQATTGDYVCYLTDKMFVLPDALARVADAISRAGAPDLVSWTSDAYNPDRYPDYFGAGTYYALSPASRPGELFRRYSPSGALDRRGRAAVSRAEQTPADYARGKVVFGAYRRTLIDRITNRFGGLFHAINPDYTSMVLGLTEARTAIEMAGSCVVSVNTDLSNGLLTDASDAAMYAFLDSVGGGIEAILPNLLVPGLYASQQNCVAHDYLSLRTHFGLTFAFDRVNWLAYCYEDIYRTARVWSSPSVEADQKGRLEAFMASQEPAVAEAVRRRVAERAMAAEARVRVPAPPRERSAPLRLAGRVRRRLVPRRPPPPLPAPSVHDSVLDALVKREGYASAPMHQFGDQE
jgi:hypothetical protein